MRYPVWKEIFLFEVRYHLRQPLVYVTGLALLLLALMFISTGMATRIENLPGAVNHNAPFVILKFMSVLTAFGIFVVTAFGASSALRDFRQGTHELFFSKPFGKLEYLTGRFAGSMVVSFLVLGFGALGIVLGAHAPWQDPELIGPFAPSVYLYGLLVILLPNMLMMGGIFFSVASLSRSLLATYVCVVIFVILQDEAEVLVRNVEYGFLGSLIEPLGIVALGHVARYWTIAEYNSLLPGLAPGLLVNRLLWVGMGLVLFVWSCHRFSYVRAARGGARKRKRITAPAVPVSSTARSRGATTATARGTRSSLVGIRQVLRQARLETGLILRSIPFLIFFILGMTFIIFFVQTVADIRGTSVYPVTHLMLKSIGLAMALFLTIVVTIYSGESLWRERSLGLDQIYDALPVSNGVFLGAKLLALGFVVALFIIGGILTTIGFQIFQGFFDIQPGLYMRGFLVTAWPFFLYAAAALFLQVLTNNKFAGYLLMILLFLTRFGLPFLGVEHNLLRFPSHMGMPYSDMNGYGHHVAPYIWFKVYWSFAALVLVCLSVLFLVRGTESNLKARLAAARSRLRGPLPILGLLGLLAFVATGCLIYRNTNILNEYIPKGRAETLQAEYERLYRQYEALPQPRVAAVRADVEIFPSERRVEMRGTYTLENRSAVAIPALHLSMDPRILINRMDAGSTAQVTSDPVHGYHIHEFGKALGPGEGMILTFDLTLRNQGFVNHSPDRTVVGNGTFFTNSYMPYVGYDASAQIVDASRRRKLGLPPAPRMASLGDETARRSNYVTANADWVDFETVVSTDPDQIAIAPGYLVREWEENGRRHFHYKMDAPILNFFSYSSARYEVRRDRWEDVEIAVYHHAGHPYNVDRMIDAVKKSLDYYTLHFGPYQHRQVRIIEFPAYATYAQAFPNTIPFSEAAGFIARFKSRKDIDYVFNTTAHEVAHQWWAHQVIGANAQGATMLSESLSEYSALMVMEKEYGQESMRRFLKYELDGYLRGRGREVKEEMPLMLVEDQNYIHYNKGSLVFYALRDYIGEERLNRALSRYLADFAFQGPPYSTSADLLEYIRQETPPELQYLLEDLFETLTLYANKAVAATYTRQEDGSYLVNLEVEARKLRADGEGVETEVPMDDWVDIGVLDISGRPLFLEKRRISGPVERFEIVVSEEPAAAGIDPLNKLIDREPEDNTRSVRPAGKAN